MLLKLSKNDAALLKVLTYTLSIFLNEWSEHYSSRQLWLRASFLYAIFLICTFLVFRLGNVVLRFLQKWFEGQKQAQKLNHIEDEENQLITCIMASRFLHLVCCICIYRQQQHIPNADCTRTSPLPLEVERLFLMDPRLKNKTV